MLSAEQGKSPADAAGETHGFAYWLRETATLSLPEVVNEDSAQRLSVTRRVPLGVVGAVVPWNYPIGNACFKLAPALLAGNTVVWKQSPFTPLTTLRTGEILRGVLPDIDVHDVDALDVLAERLFRGAFANSGHLCLAIKRLYIHTDVYEPLTRALATHAARVRLAPLQNRLQYERVLGLIQDSRDQEDEQRAGYFVPPTFIDKPPEHSRIVQEEQFGPVLPLLRYDDIDDAVARANAGPYGLGASVWSADPGAALAVGRRLAAGTVWINEVQHLSPLVTFGGHKQSCIGSEGGVEGLYEYTVPRTVTEAAARTVPLFRGVRAAAEWLRGCGYAACLAGAKPKMSTAW
ncbi:aldehyde dehydrogenase family protein [Streptomyces sp. NPDC091292]|uniref:aldehyde dehydrogenase family protein n=1 Tax=Streptomyces sp. NPDC091292 TaxID=3365991 RepID=UPI00380D8C7B